MPMYEITCPKCKAQDVVYRRIADFDNLPQCACGGVFQRRISAPAVHASFIPFKSPATGKMIETRAQQQEDLKRSGCFVYEKGVEKDIARWGQESREKAFAPIAAGVDTAVSQLVAAGKLST